MPESPTLEASMKVRTVDLRAAVTSTLPHASKVSTGDDQSENRIRFTFAENRLYVTASNSNGASTALAAVSLKEDTRGEGVNVYDGPMVADLQLRQARLLLQQFKAKPADPDADQYLEFTMNLAERWIEVLDIGGLHSEGECTRFMLLDRDSNFPDIIGITAQALAEANAALMNKALVTDGTVLAQFRAASVAYGAPLQCDGVGSENQRGFLITCGGMFLGTVESRHGDDDSLKRRDSIRKAWLKDLPARKLKTA
jgi:hypothetical protein